MKRQKYSWLAYCLACIMTIGIISALPGCGDTDSGNGPGTGTNTTEYTVTIDSGITNGTVTANPMKGTQRTQINITVTPDEGYRLQAGSLKRNNTAITTTTATGYRFNMPAANVTIYAVFESDVAGPVDYSQYREELLAIIADMTLDEKIGQMAEVERGQLNANYQEEVKQYFLGSILSGGGSGPGDVGGTSTNYANSTVAQWFTFTDNLVKASMETTPRGPMADKPNPVTGGTGYGIPFVYGIDAVHGHANAIQHPTVFPHNPGMAAIAVGDLEAGIKAIYDAGVLTAKDLYATGIRFNFNPLLGVGQSSKWGRMHESYSENPEIVAAMAASYVRGIQSTGKVAACAKHFGFEGQIFSGNSISAGNATVGDLNSPENRAILAPYQAAIDAGILSIMTFYGQVNGVKPVRYKDLIDILKKPKEEGGMGFQGFVVSDWQDIGTSGSSYKNNIATSINAGVDMAMLCNSRANWLDFISHVKDLVTEGTVSMERINDAVYRILLFKKVFGILDDPIVPSAGTIGTPEDRLVARNIAAKTLVLLKNKDDIVGKLSGNTYTNILIAGEGSAHLGIQCGGWTRQWQGQTTATIENFTGTNIETGIRNALQGTGKNVQRTADGTAPTGFTPDVVIAVVSEVSYAEGTGDASDPAIGTNATNVSKGVTSDTPMLANVYGHNVPVVLIVMAGRPIKLQTTTGGVTTNHAEKCDGIVAVWLPGSEGGDAIADVLFGDTDFVGKTPFTWRITPYTLTDPGEVVFPYGWGLKKGEMATPTL